MSEKLNLFTEKMQKLYFNFQALEELYNDLEYILSISPMNSLNFARKNLRNEEVKTNNQVEGYNDDIEYIENFVNENSRKRNAKELKEQRILNLYKGYNYILKRDDIDKESLKKLYQILSRNLLCPYDLNHMGDYYRNEDVFIYTSNNVQKEPDKGIDTDKVDLFMNTLIEFINTDHSLNSSTNHYIKSQIIHFYFVYIHPYFDVNGRTSRTLSMWYLLNNQIYPYVIFNRGINFSKNTYYKAILEAKKFGNLTIFIKYMMQNVKEELEKEYALLEIEKNVGNLSNLERQSINYILSMKNNMTLKDFSDFYKRFNEKRKYNEIDENIFSDLIEKNIIIPGRTTKGKLNNGKDNYFFNLNEDLIEDYNKLVLKLK